MPEPTLSLTKGQIKAEIAWNLGYGRTAYIDDDDQAAEVEAIFNSGYRQFLYPPKLDPQQPQHVWEFLKKSFTIDLLSGQNVYSLPDDFGGISEDLTYASAQI